MSHFLSFIVNTSRFGASVLLLICIIFILNIDTDSISKRKETLSIPVISKDSSLEFLNYNPDFVKVNDNDYMYYSQDMIFKFYIDLANDNYWKHINYLYYNIHKTFKIKESIRFKSFTYKYSVKPGFNVGRLIKSNVDSNVYMAYKYEDRLLESIWDIKPYTDKQDHLSEDIKLINHKQDLTISHRSRLDSSVITIDGVFNDLDIYTAYHQGTKFIEEHKVIKREVTFNFNEYKLVVYLNKVKIYRNNLLILEETIEDITNKKLKFTTYYLHKDTKNMLKFLEISVDDNTYRMSLDYKKSYLLQFSMSVPKGHLLHLNNLIIEPII